MNTTLEKSTPSIKKLCPHCKTEVDSKASRCPHCQGKIHQWTTGKIIVAVILGWAVFSTIISMGTDSPKPSATLTQEQIQQQADDLVAWQKTPAGKLCAKHLDWKKDDCDSAIGKKVWVGMPLTVLTYYYGAPDSDNISDYGRGTQHQYCWDDYKPSCYYDKNSDGIIDSYN